MRSVDFLFLLDPQVSVFFGLNLVGFLGISANKGTGGRKSNCKRSIHPSIWIFEVTTEAFYLGTRMSIRCAAVESIYSMELWLQSNHEHMCVYGFVPVDRSARLYG